VKVVLNQMLAVAQKHRPKLLMATVTFKFNPSAKAVTEYKFSQIQSN
jgi:hypothetical protein